MYIGDYLGRRTIYSPDALAVVDTGKTPELRLSFAQMNERANREAKERNFTLHVVAADQPANVADRGRNTVYIGKDGKTVMAGFRIYVSDRGYDGSGWGPADTPSTSGPGFTYEASLADGSRLSQQEVTQRFAKPMGSAPPPISADVWYKLVDNKANAPCMTPATAPACEDTPFRIFTGNL